MYRLLTVDDEPYILNSLRELFAGVQEPELDVYSARSSTEAIRIMEHWRIDIVLTDIHMPVMNGLTLFEKIRTFWPKCRVIFLTAYDEFRYIQTAMRHGGVDYLLKTDDNETIVAAVKKAADLLEESLERENVLRNSRMRMTEALPLLQKEYLHRLVRGAKSSPESRRKKFAELGISLGPGDPVVLVIGRVDEWSKYHALEDRDLMLYAIQNIAGEHLSQVRMSSVVIDPSQFFWLVQGGALFADGTGLVHYLQNHLDLIQKTCNRFLQLQVSFITSATPVHWDSLEYKYSELRPMLYRGLGAGSGVILIEKPADTAVELSNAKSAFLKEFHKLDQLETLLDSGKRNEFAAVFSELQAASNAMGDAVFTELYFRIAAILLAQFNHSGMPASFMAEIGWNGITARDRQPYVREQALNELFAAFQRCFDWKTDDLSHQTNEVIDRLHQYIENHLEKELTLTTLADVVYLHPDYLSRMYKQKTGEGLYDYMTRVRLAKAKELLRQSSLKIQEVGEKVGIYSNSYFSRFFKKHMNLSPQEYRDSVR